MKFNEFNLECQLLKAVEEIGYQTATYIQEKCIPLVMEGLDIIGQSQTGTGKTAAFALPILSCLQENPQRRPQVLILCPTRELCIQVCQEMRKFAKYMEGVRIVPIYGGQPITTQIRDLKGGVEIIVGTPGRILDHINRKTLRFNQLRTFVLDEADEMLNMGFREEIETIIKSLPEERQTLLFSATMPKPILEITKLYQQNPTLIKVAAEQITAPKVEQLYYEVNQGSKKELLLQLLQLYQPELSMIFCNTKKSVDDLTADLQAAGYQAACIHGDMKQEMRSIVMERFKNKKIDILVATDVAARGIDVNGMDIVFNFDVPQELEYYIHRIGRTARAGNEGIAITFITPRQKNYLKQIERLTKSSIQQKQLPKLEDLLDLRIQTVKAEIINIANKNTSKEVNSLLWQLNQEGYDNNDILLTLLNEKLGSGSLKEIKSPKSEKRIITHKTMTRIELNVGKRQRVSAAHIVSAIAEACHINGNEIGKIQIGDSVSIVEIPSQYDTKMIEEISNTTIRGLSVKVSFSNAPMNEKRKTNRTKNSRVSDFKNKSKTDHKKDYRNLPKKQRKPKNNK